MPRNSSNERLHKCFNIISLKLDHSSKNTQKRAQKGKNCVKIYQNKLSSAVDQPKGSVKVRRVDDDIDVLDWGWCP